MFLRTFFKVLLINNLKECIFCSNLELLNQFICSALFNIDKIFVQIYPNLLDAGSRLK